MQQGNNMTNPSFSGGMNNTSNPPITNQMGNTNNNVFNDVNQVNSQIKVRYILFFYFKKPKEEPVQDLFNDIYTYSAQKQNNNLRQSNSVNFIF